MARYPHAAWRPLPENSTEGPNHPRLFIVHTMVGWNHGTEQWFRRENVKSESHFGLADDPSRTDPLRQWIDTDREADTNWDANGISVTVECEDRGDPSRPFSDYQIEQLVRLGVWAHDTHGIPLDIASSWDGSGYGWHQQYPEWNRSSHNCPGTVRRRQLIEDVYPEVFRRARRQEIPVDAVILVDHTEGTPDAITGLQALFLRPELKVGLVVNVDAAKKALAEGKRVYAVGRAARLIDGDRDLAGANRLETAEDVLAQGRRGW